MARNSKEDEEKDESKVPEVRGDKSEEAEIAEEIRGMPPKVREHFMGMFQSFQRGPFLVHPLQSLFEQDKFNKEHIHKFLDNAEKDDIRSHRVRLLSQWLHLSYVIFSLITFIFLVVFLLPSNKDLLTDILKTAVIFGGGIGAGFGIKSYKDKKG